MAKVWFLGHSCIRIEIGGKSLILDPFIRPNSAASHIDFASLKADYILVSHGHQDHLADLVDLAKQTQALVISNYELINWLEKQGYKNTRSMNHGGSILLGGVNVKMVQAVHSSSLPDGSYAGNPAGFVIWSEKERIYFAGDTALTMDMLLIAQEFVINLAILPIGDVYTMGVSDAVKCAKMVECNKVMGIHYDTFPPIKIDKIRAKKEFEDAGFQLLLPNIGEAIEL
jgi:L-ascorbate metabolism protein UlaG (beta-lactamase superfamily)